jgi:E3 ubiquitin-protein ligase Mdm2
MAASSTGQAEMVKFLLSRGASINLHAQGGITALMFSAMSQDAGTVKLLCAARASPEAVQLERQDHVRIDGRRTAPKSHTALEIAETQGDAAIVGILREHSKALRIEADLAATALLLEEDAIRSRAEDGKKRRSRKRQALRSARLAHQDAEAAGDEGKAHVDPVVDPTPPSSLVMSAAAEAARRYGARLSQVPPPPPPPPPSTPNSRRRALNGLTSPSSSLSASVELPDRLLALCASSAAASSVASSVVSSAASSVASSVVSSVVSSVEGPSSAGGSDEIASTSRASATSTVQDGPKRADETEELEQRLREMAEMERRAAAKNLHMQELDERFEQLQLARATSNHSLVAMGSSTSLASLDSASGLETDQMTCVICMEKPSDATLVHGRSAHVCCCLECAANLQHMGHSCPMCRKPIEAVLQLYFA